MSAKLKKAHKTKKINGQKTLYDFLVKSGNTSGLDELFPFKDDQSLLSRCYISDSSPTWLSLTFSDGNFEAIGKPTKPSVGTSEESPTEVKETRDEQEATTKAIYSCPQDGCTRTFQRHAALERHLSFERCTKSVERGTLLDHAKKQYAARVLEGVGKIPALTSISVSTTKTTEGLKEGWALKQVKKTISF